jgi:hypothetical protein
MLKKTNPAGAVLMALVGVTTSSLAAEGPSPGYYRIERDARLQASTGGGGTVKLQGRSPAAEQGGVEEWKAQVNDGPVAQKPVESPAQHQCVQHALSIQDWQAILVSSSGGTKADVRVRKIGPDEWEMAYPMRIDSATPSSFTQMRQGMRDPRLLQGMSSQEREQMRAALAQLPQASEVAQSQAQLAQAIEAEAASASGAQAKVLREQAQRLRSGAATPVWQGETVERWKRIGDQCPK